MTADADAPGAQVPDPGADPRPAGVDALALHARALDEFGRRVHLVHPGQWALPTPDDGWDVRALVRHLVSEQLRVPPLLRGQSAADVGDRFDGDVLGGDPVEAWCAASDAARACFRAPGALDREVALSSGPTPVRDYLAETTLDLTAHAWDLARAIGVDEHLDDALVAAGLSRVAGRADDLAASGLFGAPVPVPDDAPPRVRLLALLGRDAR